MAEKESNSKKNTPNPSMPSQSLAVANKNTKNEYIFELAATGFKSPPQPSDINKKNSVLGEGFPDKAERHFYTEIKKCRCNPRLRLFDFAEFNVDAELDFYDEGGSLYYIQLQDGYYYNILGAMTNVIHGSPDNEDPPPAGPIKTGSEDWKEYELDEYIPLRKAFLEAARNHADTYSNAPVVAIMDSGIDLRYFYDENDKVNFPLHYYNNHPCDLCPNLCYICDCDCNQGIYGWDFIKSDPHRTFPENPFDDDKRHKHGTRIAKIIADVTDNYVRIMPLKTANYIGESQFFDIFCAFEYIMSYNNRSEDKDKIKFINASWGYYGNEYKLFTHYMEKLKLREENPPIKFITAAGNAGDLGENLFFRRVNPPLLSLDNLLSNTLFNIPIINSLAVNVSDAIDGIRDRIQEADRIEIDDIENQRRYPTMYCKDFHGVYTATTVRRNDNDEIVAVENYSDVYVEVGVVSERDGPINGTFNDPLTPQNEEKYIKGSSYATAYLTGALVNGEEYERVSPQQLQELINNPPHQMSEDINSGLIVIETSAVNDVTKITEMIANSPV